MVQQGVMVPTSQVTETTGARELDEEALDDVHELEREAALTKGAAQVIGAQGQLAAAEQQRDAVEDQLNQRKAQQAAVETDWQNRMRQMEAESKALSTREVDPRRYVHSMSTWEKLGTGIASILFTMAQGGSPVTFSDLIQREVQADIDSQQEQLTAERGRVSNGLSRMAQEYGGIQVGRAALENLMLEATAKRAEAMAARTGVATAQAGAQALAQELRARQAANLIQMKEAAKGQTVQRVQQQFVQPQAATPGYYRAQTPKERREDVEGYLKTRGLVADVAKKEAELAGGGKKGKPSPTMLERQANAEIARDLALDTMKSMGIRKTEGGSFSADDIPGYGIPGQFAPDAITSAEGIRNRSAVRDVATAYLKGRDERPSEDKIDQVVANIVGDGRIESVATGLASIHDQMERRARSFEKTGALAAGGEPEEPPSDEGDRGDL
jgi:hypothetical protein